MEEYFFTRSWRKTFNSISVNLSYFANLYSLAKSTPLVIGLNIFTLISSSLKMNKLVLEHQDNIIKAIHWWFDIGRMLILKQLKQFVNQHTSYFWSYPHFELIVMNNCWNTVSSHWSILPSIMKIFTILGNTD